MIARLLGVRASAGSGKTHALGLRFVDLLGTGAAPDRILAATFTRKAAGEIGDRVLRALAETARNDPAGRARLAQVVRSLHRLRIGTLDSFFHRLARIHALDVGLPESVRLLDERSAEADALRMEAVQRVLSARDQSGRAELVRLLDQRVGPESPRPVAKDLSSNLYSLRELFRSAPDPAWEFAPPGRPLPEEEVVALVAAIPDLPAATESMRKALLSDHRQAEARDWSGFLGSGVGSSVARCISAGEPEDQWRYSRTPLGPEVCRVYGALVRHARDVLLEQVLRERDALRELLGVLNPVFEQLCREREVMFYSDVPHLLARIPDPLVGAPARFRLDQRLEHLLLDEFQDTTPAQWRILEPLARRIAASGSGTVFAVGDVKQAIYGWRGATPEIFRSLDRSLDGPDGMAWENYDHTYRCAPEIVETVNRVFGALPRIGALADHAEVARFWEEEFRPHERRLREGESQAAPGYVEFHLTAAVQNRGRQDDDQEHWEETHRLEAAARIAELARRYPDQTVGVLCRHNDDVQGLLTALDDLDVEASGESGALLSASPAVDTVLAALRFADHPGNTAAAFQVAHSALGAVVGLVPGPDGVPEPERIAAVSRRIRAEVLSRGLAAVLAEWSLGIAPGCREWDAERLSRLVAMADGWRSPEPLRLSRFAAHVESTAVAEPSPAHLRVMTLHASKGLEFDHVVLPELHSDLLGSPRKQEPLWEGDPRTGTVRRIFGRPPRVLSALVPEMQQARAARDRDRLIEELCLLYVGLTRARRGLVLIAPQPYREGRSLCWRRVLLEGLGLEAGQGLVYAAGAAPEPSEVHPPPRAEVPPPPLLGQTPAEERRFRVPVHPSSLSRAGRTSPREILDLSLEDAFARGKVVHLWLSLLGWADDPLPPDSELVARARREAPEWDDARIASLLPELRALLDRPVVREALARPDPALGEAEALREHSFVLAQANNLVSGTFDRVVLTREGGRVTSIHLYDWKTDPVTAGSLAEKGREYRPQLAAYREALAALYGFPEPSIHASLIFTEGYRWDLGGASSASE